MTGDCGHIDHAECGCDTTRYEPDPDYGRDLVRDQLVDDDYRRQQEQRS